MMHSWHSYNSTFKISFENIYICLVAGILKIKLWAFGYDTIYLHYTIVTKWILNMNHLVNDEEWLTVVIVYNVQYVFCICEE